MFRGVLMLLAAVSCSWAQYEPNCNNKQAIVQLFEWKWTDVAAECERFLAANGYCGVQISPPAEHIVLPELAWPWWQRYQPVSYQLNGRSGTEAQFIDMVQRCNQVGVRIYVDAVINHMTGANQKGVGHAGSTFDTTGSVRDFPAVPYTAENFTPRELCPSASGNVDNYDDRNNAYNCYLYGLVDLYHRSDYVRQTIANYLNTMVDIGVAGFLIDTAKNVWPEDIAAIESLLHDLPVDQGFSSNARPYIFQTVVEFNEFDIKVGDYYDTGMVTEFRYPAKITYGINSYEQLRSLVDYSWGMSIPERAVVFVDNHDLQRDSNIGPGDVTTFKTPIEYKQAVAYTLAQDYGFVRLMSSYYFEFADQAPPNDGTYNTLDVIINQDGSCANGWVCEHRWNIIKRMIRFRNAVVGTPMENYWNNGVAVAFSRGNKGFFAMAKSGYLQINLQTGLPQGIYCNLIDDCNTSIQVLADGTADISIANPDEPAVAFITFD